MNISSIAGLIGIPFQGVYSASKFALEGLTEALRIEVKPYGIRGVLIEPGDFRTGFRDNRCRVRASLKNTVHASQLDNAQRVVQTEETRAPTPEPIGRLLEKIITTPWPQSRYMIGSVSERIILKLKKVLSSGLFERVTMNRCQSC